MFHRSEKAVRYSKELDEARLHGHFHLVPNLARKLQKHDPSWAKSAVCEKTLNDLVAPLEREQRIKGRDSPDNLPLPPTIRPENMKEIVVDVEEALSSTGTTEEKQLAEVIAGQMWFTMGQWRKVIEKTERPASGEITVTNQGYGYVLVLKSHAYQGMAYEGLEKFNAALETYILASDYIHGSQFTSTYYSVQYWITRILYRLCLLSLRLQDPLASLDHFRRYKRLMDTNFRANVNNHERLTLYYWYWRTLSDIVRRQVEENRDLTATNSDKGNLEARVTFYELKDELLEIQNHYESLLMSSTRLPHAGSTNPRILDLADRVMENWKMLGSDPADAKEIVQILYRGASKTFQSPRIMRYLMYALDGSGNHGEAEYSLDAYLLIVENEEKTLTKLGSEKRKLDDQDIISDIDSHDDIVKAVAYGIRLLVKYQNKGKKAMDLAQKLERQLTAWKIIQSEILAIANHAIGMAYSLWSTQTIESDIRPKLQNSAVKAYLNAISSNPKKLETHFQLALQYAWQRDLDKAILSLSHGLHLNKTHIPSIHLLVLILTALGDYEKALQTCHTIALDNLHDLNVDDAIAMMEMQLTYLRIVEVVSGRDLALEVQKGVFKLYNRLFGSVVVKTPEFVKKTVPVESKANLSDQSLRRVRSDLNREKGFSNSNSLAPYANRDSLESKLSLQVPSNRVGRKRSLLKRRPRSHSLDGGSNNSRSSAEFSEKSEKDQNSQLHDANQTTDNVSDTTPAPRKQDTVSKTPIIQQLPAHASDLPPKVTPSPSEHREKAAKLYRAKLWLACSGIYRRGRQWDGAQAAIRDALLCDICPEEVYTELGNLYLDQMSHFEATANFERALLHNPDYPPANIGLACALLTSPDEKNPISARDRAEVHLDSVTKISTWDNSEAWYWLGEIYEQCEMPEKAAECWMLCEDLEKRKPIQDWHCVKPEWI